MLDKIKTGVYEWADESKNIQIGCENDCRYCYARHRAVDRFGYCESNEAWKTPIINYIKVDKTYRKNYGTVMYPSTHDITPLNIDESISVLRKLLAAGNNVLVVSKPHYECIERICFCLSGFKKQILFRFTIGSTKDDVLKFWEAGASNYKERISCLKHAYHLDYKTSVSCEPFLDTTPEITYDACRRFITDSFWIGKLRGWHRVLLGDVTAEQNQKYVEPLKAAQSDEHVSKIYKLLKDKPLVEWKDSIREVVGL